jgi:hypothetical protein
VEDFELVVLDRPHRIHNCKEDAGQEEGSHKYMKDVKDAYEEEADNLPAVHEDNHEAEDFHKDLTVVGHTKHKVNILVVGRTLAAGDIPSMDRDDSYVPKAVMRMVYGHRVVLPLVEMNVPWIAVVMEYPRVIQMDVPL